MFLPVSCRDRLPQAAVNAPWDCAAALCQETGRQDNRTSSDQARQLPPRSAASSSGGGGCNRGGMRGGCEAQRAAPQPRRRRGRGRAAEQKTAVAGGPGAPGHERRCSRAGEPAGPGRDAGRARRLSASRGGAAGRGCRGCCRRQVAPAHPRPAGPGPSRAWPQPGAKRGHPRSSLPT